MIQFFIKINDEKIFMIYIITKPYFSSSLKKKKDCIIFIILKIIAINLCFTLILLAAVFRLSRE